MERRILQPEQIIVPGEYELGNESILKIYFRIFDRGHGADLPPVIVAHHSIGNRGEEFYELNQHLIGSYRDKLDRYLEQGSEYFLLDGNHKAVASALLHQPIRTLELQTDKDLEKIKEMVEKGELFNWKHGSASLREIVNDFEDFCSEHLDQMTTVDERVKQLTSNGDLPQYMKERYHKGK